MQLGLRLWEHAPWECILLAGIGQTERCRQIPCHFQVPLLTGFQKIVLPSRFCYLLRHVQYCINWSCLKVSMPWRISVGSTGHWATRGLLRHVPRNCWEKNLWWDLTNRLPPPDHQQSLRESDDWVCDMCRPSWRMRNKVHSISVP